MKKRDLVGLAVVGVGLGVFAAADSEIPAAEYYRQAEQASGAVQSWYTEGVPHTDRRGNVRMQYDPEQSLFPIGMWGVPMHQEGGEYDWSKLNELHINTVWPYASITPGKEVLDTADRFGYQVIFMHEIPEETLRQVKDHPRLLGNVWIDEPIGFLEQPGKMEELMAKFIAYKTRANAIAPSMAVFINDAPWVMDPATKWFIQWNTAGDVACHDNYPIKVSSSNVTDLASLPNGIPQSTALTTLANHQAKPVWLIVGAFEQAYTKPGEADKFPYRYPTPEQLRAQVYTGIVYGATGIHYFIWDSYISRDGTVLGMSPDPRVEPSGFLADSPRATRMNELQMAHARALWQTVGVINRELQELTPALLSPTVKPSELGYSVTADIVAGVAQHSDPVRTMLKPWPGRPGEYILLSVNVEAVTADVKIRFDRAPASAEVMFDSSLYPAQLQGDTVTLRYEPFAAHVLRLRFDR